MAFDVYVGTLTRYYQREWENVAQRMAREQGIRYKTIYAGGPPPTPPAAEEMHEAFNAWCEMLEEGLGSLGVSEVSWDESDSQPYFTQRPGWEGYRGLVLWASYAENLGLRPPRILPDDWTDDPAFKKSTKEGFGSQFLQILRAQLWIPVDFNAVAEGPDLCQNQTCIGSTFELKRQLEALEEGTKQRLILAKAESSEWRQAPSKSGGLLRRLFAKARRSPLAPATEEQPGTRLIDAAENGLSIFQELARKACEHTLPILLDF